MKSGLFNDHPTHRLLKNTVPIIRLCQVGQLGKDLVEVLWKSTLRKYQFLQNYAAQMGMVEWAWIMGIVTVRTFEKKKQLILESW